MNINEVINTDSRFLKAPDLKGRKIGVRIEAVTTEDFKELNGNLKRQIVLKFFGAQKLLGLNKTNTKMIASMYGDETDKWIGKEIQLYPTKTQNQHGQIVDCIRIEYQAPSFAAPARPAPVASNTVIYDERNPPPHIDHVADMSDSVPF